MKLLKNSLVSFLILLFFLPAPTLSKRRNLSTPLSRLAGHWQTPEGGHWYFGIISYPDMRGSFIRVLPDKKTWIKLLEKDKASGTLNEAEIKEARKFIERYTGVASYCQYKVIYQEPKGIRIKIQIYWNDYYPERGDLDQITLYINKNGKQMKKAIKVPYVDEEFFDEYQTPIKYIDSKTTPDDGKMGVKEEKSVKETEMPAKVITPFDLRQSIQIVNVETKWVSKYYQPWPPKLILVPAISFRVKNITEKPLHYINFNANFRFRDSYENLGDCFLATFRRKPINPGETSDIILLKSNYGVEGKSLDSFKNNPRWKVVIVKLFAQSKGLQYIQLGEWEVSKKIDFKEPKK